jgi:hypothetical protein
VVRDRADAVAIAIVQIVADAMHANRNMVQARAEVATVLREEFAAIQRQTHDDLSWDHDKDADRIEEIQDQKLATRHADEDERFAFDRE